MNEIKKSVPVPMNVQYQELSRYFIEAAKLRFTVLGFLVAGSFIFYSNARTFWQYLFMATVTIWMWVIEIKNRILARQLSVRAEEMEEKGMGEFGYFGDLYRRYSIDSYRAAKDVNLNDLCVFISYIAKSKMGKRSYTQRRNRLNLFRYLRSKHHWYHIKRHYRRAGKTGKE